LELSEKSGKGGKRIVGSKEYAVSSRGMAVPCPEAGKGGKGGTEAGSRL